MTTATEEMKTSNALQLLLAASGASAASIRRREADSSAEVRRDPLAVTENYVRLRKTAAIARRGRNGYR